MRIFKNILQTVGRTPLVELSNFSAHFGVSNLLAKVEGMEPAGSVKDRVGLEMINDAEQRGLLNPGSVIIEPTSGNTGIGLAAVAACRGYRLVLTMPDTMSIERRKLLAAYGAEIVLTDGAEGMPGAIEAARALADRTPGAFMPGQFINPANPLAHYKTTGPEIWQDTDGGVDFFVAGVGTGGTLSGVGRYLKEKKPGVQVIAAEPENSAVLSGGSAGPHGLQGIGAGFIPDTLDTGIYNSVVRVTDGQAYLCARLLAKKEGILSGISAGAALHAAVETAKLNPGAMIVALLPDTGDRYLSTALFDGV